MTNEKDTAKSTDKQEDNLTDKERQFLAAKRELFLALGLSIETIDSPESAPTIVDFARFWKQIGISEGYRGKEIVFPGRSEVYVGADYKPKAKKIDIAEYAIGKEFEVTYKRNHFIEIHNEPYDPSITNDVKELQDNLPDAYFDDMSVFLVDDKVFCSIIIRMIDDKSAGVVMVMKTDCFRGVEFVLDQATKHYPALLPDVQETLEKDDILIRVNKAVVYRGFVDIPPKRGKSYLRKRKPD